VPDTFLDPVTLIVVALHWLSLEGLGILPPTGITNRYVKINRQLIESHLTVDVESA
jgi:hypothetical protein